MGPKQTPASVDSTTGNQTNAASQKAGQSVGENSIVVDASRSLGLSEVGFSFDRSKADVAPPLTEEQQGRYRLLRDASRYISNRNPAESLDNFPERGELQYRQLSVIKLYNETLGTNLPVSQNTHRELGGDKAILTALVDDAHWDTIRKESSWNKYVDYAEARVIAGDLASRLVGKIVTERDISFGVEQKYTVTQVAASGTMITIQGIGQDQSPQTWSGDLKVLTTSSSGGQLLISNRYGSELSADVGLNT